MFGFIVANNDIMNDEERCRYKSVYCGLCRSLRERHGRLGRLALNYDMTFLAMVLGSLYEPEECRGCERCFVHPASRHDFLCSEISDYAADMTIALSYLNLLDNWRDDRNFLSLFAGSLLKGRYKKVAANYPRQCRAMEDCVEKLSELERTGEENPDSGARLFGALMAELFVIREDRWASILREMAMNLGGFIYIMDAVVDLEKDIKKGRYNPLAALSNAGRKDEFFRELLTVLIGNCIMELEKLPLVEDVSLMRNILCSGVWAKYNYLHVRKKEKRD